MIFKIQQFFLQGLKKEKKNYLKKVFFCSVGIMLNLFSGSFNEINHYSSFPEIVSRQVTSQSCYNQ